MVKYIIPLIMILALSGCKQETVRTVYVDVPYPIHVVPHPPEVERPVLHVTTLTEEQRRDAGELVRSHRISLQQAIEYSKILERIINTYRDAANRSQAELDAFSPTGPRLMGMAVSPLASPLLGFEAIMALEFDAISADAESLKETEYVTDDIGDN